MDFRIDEEDRLLREALRRALDESAAPATRRASDPPAADPARWRQLAGGGWFEGFLADPAATVGDGGADGPRIAAVRGVGLAEEFGRHALAEPVAMAAGFLLPLLHWSGEDAARHLVGELTAGDLVAAAPTAHVPADDDDGVWGFGSRTPVLRADADGWVLEGAVAGVEVPPGGSSLCTPARIGDGRAVVVLVPVTARGVRLDLHDTILPGRQLADVVFEAVGVTSEQFVVEERDRLLRALTAGRVAFGLFLDGLALGGAQAVIDRTIAYAQEREQFGVPIGSFQAVKHLLADAVVAVEGARSLTYHLAWEVEQLGWLGRLEGLAVSRLNAARMYREVAEVGIQVRGATGFTWEDGAHRWLRAATFDALEATRVKRLERALAVHLLDEPVG